jgi:hypothetical protein
MNRTSILSGLLAGLLLAVAGCDSNSYGGSSTMPPPPPPPPPPQATDFAGFVKDQFAATADDTDPVDVDDEDFAFSDQDDAAAFDDLLNP